MPTATTKPTTIAHAWDRVFSLSTGLNWADLAHGRAGRPHWADGDISPPYELNPDQDPCHELRTKAARQVSRQSIADSVAALNLANQHIQILTPGFLTATVPKLTRINLCGNAIESIQSHGVFPATLVELNLSLNRLPSVPNLSACPHLLHANLSYNHIASITAIHELLPAQSLRSLDLSFNHLIDTAATKAALEQVSSVRLLCLQGNPLSLVSTYRNAFVSALPKLTALDDIPTKLPPPPSRPVSASTATCATLDPNADRVVRLKVFVGSLLNAPDISAQDLRARLCPPTHHAAAITATTAAPGAPHSTGTGSREHLAVSAAGGTDTTAAHHGSSAGQQQRAAQSSSTGANTANQQAFPMEVVYSIEFGQHKTEMLPAVLQGAPGSSSPAKEKGAGKKEKEKADHHGAPAAGGQQTMVVVFNTLKDWVADVSVGLRDELAHPIQLRIRRHLICIEPPMPRDSQLNLAAGANSTARRPSFKGSTSAAATNPAAAPAAPTSRPTSPKGGGKSGTSPGKKGGHKAGDAVGASLGTIPPEAKRVIMASETLGSVELDVSELLYGDNSVVVMPGIAVANADPGALNARPLVAEVGVFLDRPPQRQPERANGSVGMAAAHVFASLTAEELAGEFLRERDMAVRQQYMQMMGGGQADSRAGGMTSATPGAGGTAKEGKEGNGGAGGKKVKG